MSSPALPPPYRHRHQHQQQQQHFIGGGEDFASAAAAEFPSYVDDELAFQCASAGTTSLVGGSGAATTSAAGVGPASMHLEDGGRDSVSPGSPSSGEVQRPACEYAARSALPGQLLPGIAYPACLADLTARLSWINWESLGVNPNRRSVLTTLTLTADTIGCHNGTQ
ncbi:N-twist protein, putative [Ixodes scapularis]|uniref:N-twist protein, putative n=1 Tax=Ixodes scapularis TaxID=6945 RepID=B7P1F1_IXOSC|nr:N-twist protein, putative [Ixodes scapularis]|eukprot:XP_002433359.1 N-twist protein, putative [Ixodes scapularis]